VNKWFTKVFSNEAISNRTKKYIILIISMSWANKSADLAIDLQEIQGS